MKALNSRFFHLTTVLLFVFAATSATAETVPDRNVKSNVKKDAPMTMNLTSDSFQNNGTIPALHTCEGKDISPQLAWTGVPENAKSLVLIVDDPDAPDPAAPQRTWVHWVLYNIPVDVTGLKEGVSGKELSTGTLQGNNDWKRTKYGGPCPPIGKHRYFFKLYALDTVLPDLKQPSKAAVEKAMQGHVLAQAELIGLYQKQR